MKFLIRKNFCLEHHTQLQQQNSVKRIKIYPSTIHKILIHLFITITFVQIRLQQKYHYNQPTNRPMKGVKINNYIDNRIVLSGRKLKDEVQAVQTLIHSHRNQPLVIRNLHYDKNQEGQLIQDKQTTRQIQHKSNKKKRKRTKTSTNNLDIKLQLNQKQQRKINSREGHRKITSAKKKSPESSASKGSVVNFNQTEKKLIKVCKSSDGLTRSKSTIIKGVKYPFPQFQKKQQPSSKFNFDKKEIETHKKKSVKKDKKSNGKGVTKKNPQVNKTGIKKIKPEKQQGLKTSRPKSRSNLLITKSKLDSARQNKNKQQVGGQKGKKLILQKEKKREKKVKKDKEHLTIQQLLEMQKKDLTLKDALYKLQEAINSGGKNMNLSQKLQMLAQRLNQLNQEDLQESATLRQINKKKKSNIQMENNQIRAFGQINSFTPHEMSEKKQQSHQSENQADNAFTNTKIADNLLKKEEKKEEQKELNSQSEQESSCEEQIQIPAELTQEISEKNLVSINKQMEEKREIYKKDPDNFRGIINRNGRYDQQMEQENPLIGRKAAGDSNIIDLADYDSINSVKSNQSNIEKMQQINQLKKFQQESDQMMKRIKQLEGKKKSNEQQKNNTKQIKLENNSQILNGQKSPKGFEVKDYAFQKYPKTIQGIKSPKFSSHQILQVVKLKQKIFTDRHEKLSELVNVMFDKKIVSPKTYSIHIQTLREQQMQNNEVMDNYKKHAEELAQLLSQIKKQKEQITNIDEMIRSENWDEAVCVIKSNQKKIVIRNKPDQNLIKPYILTKQQDENKSQNEKSRQLLEDITSEKPFYYDGQKSEEDNGFQLIPIQHDEAQVQPQNLQKNNSLIKIDQGDVVNPKRRGFDSNLFFIKQYCIALCQYVRDNHKQDFMLRIGNPMSYDLPKLLRTFRTNKDGSPAISINSLNEDLSYHDCNFHFNSPPISNKIFAQFNKSYSNIKYYCKQTSKDAELQGIFLKSIYDALNESISIEKPSSTNGKALPWAQSSKHLKNLKNSLKNSQQQRFKNQESQDLIFGIAIARIIQWGSCLCGFIPDTVQLQNTQIDEQYINHIRETRTALLLQKMLVDQQATMYKIDLEQTEVKLCLGQIICEQLISQIAQDMKKIMLRATIRSIDY